MVQHVFYRKCFSLVKAIADARCAALILLSTKGGLCRNERPSNVRVRTRVKASRPAPKPANSCARRCITSAKANMAQPLRNRRLLSDSRRRVAQVSSCPRHAEVTRPPAPARKPRAIFVKGKATPGALLPPGGQGPPRMLKRGRDILPLPMHLSPNRLEPPLAIEDHLCAEVLRGRQAARVSTQEGTRKAINPYSQPAKSIERLSLEYQRFLPCLVIGLERARLQPRRRGHS